MLSHVSDVCVSVLTMSALNWGGVMKQQVLLQVTLSAEGATTAFMGTPMPCSVGVYSLVKCFLREKRECFVTV